MAAKDKAELGALQGQALVEALRENPYVQRVINDPELRDQAREAYDSAQSAYQRAAKAKRPVKALTSDAKLQRELRTAFLAAQAVQLALRDAPSTPNPKRTRRGGGLLKGLVIAVVGAGIAMAASSSLRDKVLDLLFGPEETFDYVPTANGNGTPAAAPETESATS